MTVSKVTQSLKKSWPCKWSNFKLSDFFTDGSNFLSTLWVQILPFQVILPD